MNFNVEKAKELVKIFSKLDEENQHTLLVNASVMELEQNIKKN